MLLITRYIHRLRFDRARLTALTLTLFLALPTVTVVRAQSLPSCSDQAFDVDGDGFGWEINTSCIVDENTAPPPIVINQSTGSQVNLVRANWDANADIAGRTIQCDRFDYDAQNGNYATPENDFSTPLSYTLTHDSLLPVQREGFYWNGENTSRENFNFSGWYTLHNPLNDRGLITNSPPFWTVEDGLYVGQELLSGRYIELVKTPDNFDAIRIWYKEGERFPMNAAFEFSNTSYVSDGYYQCFDQAGADFTPTRTLGVPSPVIQPELSSIVLTVEANPNFTSGEIVNLVTGDNVPQVKAHWNYNTDLAGRRITCTHFVYDESFNDTPRYINAFSARDDYRQFFFAPLAEGSDTTVPYWTHYQSAINNPSLAINNGMVTYHRRDIFASDKVELIGNDTVRVWIDPSAATGGIISQYYECNAQPTGSANNAQDTGTTEGTDVVQANLTSVDNATDDSIVNTEDNTAVQITNDVQTNTDTTDSSPDDSTGNSNDVTTAENESTAVEDEVVASNTLTDTTSTDLVSSESTAVEDEVVSSNIQTDTTSIDLVSPDETTSQSGGGSFWLPLLIFALAFRRPLSALQKQN